MVSWSKIITFVPWDSQVSEVASDFICLYLWIVLIRFLCLTILFGEIGLENFICLDMHPVALRNSAMSFNDWWTDLFLRLNMSTMFV